MTKLLTAGVALFWISACSGFPALAEESITLTIDASQRIGVIRPLHGVNGGPLNYGETLDLGARWRELDIPLTRLHDCEWPGTDVVDMHVVFPSLKADPAQAASYDFARTDDYLAAIAATKTPIVYRLGESIEHARQKRHVHPPADYDAWAAACLGIIRHYNAGWADGFHHHIRYWEIWNEPENRPNCWTGTDDDYYRLYATAARQIKAEFPKLLVGGPAVGATGEFNSAGEWEPTDFLRGFVQHAREERLPLDFFSWHTYTNDPLIYARKAHAMRRWLDDQGFAQTEIHLNEWNYLPDNDWGPMLAKDGGQVRADWYARMAGAEGAAFTAAVLASVQDSPVDAANYFTGDSGPFGLFTRDGVPKQTFHAMRAFRLLLDTPRRVAVSGSQDGQLIAIAGTNDARDELTLLISHYGGPAKSLEVAWENLPWNSATVCQVHRLDERHNLVAEEPQTLAKDSASVTIATSASGVLRVSFKPLPAM